MKKNYQKDPFHSNCTEEDLYDKFQKSLLKDLTILSCAFHALHRGFQKKQQLGLDVQFRFQLIYILDC